MRQAYNVQIRSLVYPNENLTVYEPDTLKYPQPIIAIHGMWGTNSRWVNYGKFFSERGFLFLTPTLRHHYAGNNVPELGKTSINDYVEDIAALIHNLTEEFGLPNIGKLPKPIVFGHSMGGLIAQRVAELGLAEKLVLISSAPPAGVKLPLDLHYQLSALRYLPNLLLEKPFKPSFELYSYYILNGMPEDQRKTFYETAVYESGRAAKEIRFGKIPVNFSKINCPSLVIAGAKDRITPMQIAFDIREKIKLFSPSNLVVYSSFAHWIQTEPNWEWPAENIAKWLTSKM